MAKTLAKSKARAQPVQAPKRRQEPPRANVWLYVIGGVGLAAVGLIAFLMLGNASDDQASVGGNLPNTGDYHSLLVSPADSEQLTLGTHEGLFSSTDGGQTWSQTGLVGQDAMNLAQPGEETLWAAGHNVLARSTDGGQSWEDVRPEGLPGLDLHAFTVDANDEKTVYAALAGHGIYRSTDGGGSFSLVTDEFGAGVMALASFPDGRLLAGDMERQGLFVSSDGGETWEPVVEAQIMGIAVNPVDPQKVVASGSGVLLSTDGGRRWEQALSLPDGSGPIAWSRSEPQVAYVVGFDRSLHRTDDGGATWTSVFTGEVS